MKPIWTWRVQHPTLPIFMMGSEFWRDEARKEGLKARARMSKAYEATSPRQWSLKVTGPRGGVEELRPVPGTKTGGRWAKVRK